MEGDMKVVGWMTIKKMTSVRKDCNMRIVFTGKIIVTIHCYVHKNWNDGSWNRL